MADDVDFALALQMEEEFQREERKKKPSFMDVPGSTPVKNKNYIMKETSLIDPSWEVIDPTPDIHAMFMQFNKRFFWGKLDAVEVRWSPRMTLCAGVCCYQGRAGMCSVRLSVPLLKLRPRKDLVETLLHEMIHAYLFVTHNNRDRDGHGPEFHKHMDRINREAGTRISVYHSFHDEVNVYRQHWWRCDGPCQRHPPYFGMVKRTMNRAPGSYDFWWADHQNKCGGKYIKVREPADYAAKKRKQPLGKGQSLTPPKNDIRQFFNGKGHVLDSNRNLVKNKHGNPSLTNVVKKPVSTLLNKNSNVSANNERTPTKASKKGHGSNLNGNSDILDKNRNLVKSKNGTPSLTKVVGKPIETILNKNSNVSASNERIPTTAPKKGHGSKGSTGDAPQGSGSRVRGQGGGMLANKGGGTLVVTGNKTVSKSEVNGSVIPDATTVRTNVIPFSGKGYTLGTPTVKGDKPWLARLDKLIVSPDRACVPSKRGTNDNRSHGPSKRPKDIIVSSTQNPDIGASCSTCATSKVNCPSCNMCFTEIELNAHLDSCLQSAFINDELLQCKDDHVPKTVKCPICDDDINEQEINIHVDMCVHTSCDFSVQDLVGSEEDIKESTSNAASSIKCPMCNKEMDKSNLDRHLEICVESIFDTIVIDDDSDEEELVEIKSGDGNFPCPCCGAMVKESLMNRHLDSCISIDS